MRRFRTIALAVLLLLVVAVSAFTFSWHVRRKRLSTGYDKVQVGDTKQTVMQLFGNPEEVSNCYDPNSNDDLNKKCVEVYWYWSFLERWEISFDKDGKVIDKTYNALY